MEGQAGTGRPKESEAMSALLGGPVNIDMDVYTVQLSDQRWRDTAGRGVHCKESCDSRACVFSCVPPLDQDKANIWDNEGRQVNQHVASDCTVVLY